MKIFSACPELLSPRLGCDHISFLIAWVLSATTSLAQLPPSPVVGESPAQGDFAPWQEIGGRNFAGWDGLQAGRDGAASWNLANAATFQCPSGLRGWYNEGFSKRNDSSADWSGFYGVQLDILIPGGRVLKLEATISTPPQDDTRTTFRIAGWRSQSKAKVGSASHCPGLPLILRRAAARSWLSYRNCGSPVLSRMRRAARSS